MQPNGRIVASTAEFIGLVGFDAAGDLDASFARGASHGVSVAPNCSSSAVGAASSPN